MKKSLKTVSAVAALLTLISSAYIYPVSASAMQTDNYVLSASDIMLLRSKGVSDDTISKIQQPPSTRSATQLNHYACFVYNTSSNYNPTNTIYSEIVRTPDVTLFDVKPGIRSTNWMTTAIADPIPGLAGFVSDRFHFNIIGVGHVCAYRYTCANNVYWDTDTYYSAYHYGDPNVTPLDVWEPVLVGDIDEDGDIDSQDSVFVARIGEDDIPSGVSDYGVKAADIDCDNDCDDDDLTLILQYLADTRNCFWN